MKIQILINYIMIEFDYYILYENKKGLNMYISHDFIYSFDFTILDLNTILFGSILVYI